MSAFSSSIRFARAGSVASTCWDWSCRTAEIMLLASMVMWNRSTETAVRGRHILSAFRIAADGFIATNSTPSCDSWGRSWSLAATACPERPSTCPQVGWAGVRSMMTVMYLSPWLLCDHTCSSTTMALTPSERRESLISARLPSARTALCAVCQLTPSSYCGCSQMSMVRSA